jgi:hypothetical protein
MQCEHADFVVFAAIADEFAATGKEDEIIGAVPVLDNVETFVDLTAQRLAMQIPAQEGYGTTNPMARASAYEGARDQQSSLNPQPELVCK